MINSLLEADVRDLASTAWFMSITAAGMATGALLSNAYGSANPTDSARETFAFLLFLALLAAAISAIGVFGGRR